MRPFPAGHDRRRRGYELLHALYFLESLYVQDHHDEAATRRRAEGLRDHLATLLEAD